MVIETRVEVWETDGNYCSGDTIPWVRVFKRYFKFSSETFTSFSSVWIFWNTGLPFINTYISTSNCLRSSTMIFAPDVSYYANTFLSQLNIPSKWQLLHWLERDLNLLKHRFPAVARSWAIESLVALCSWFNLIWVHNIFPQRLNATCVRICSVSIVFQKSLVISNRWLYSLAWRWYDFSVFHISS